MVNYRRNCEVCKKYFRPDHGSVKICDECKIKLNKPAKLQKNNKKGFNKYKKNPNPKKAPRSLTVPELIIKCREVFKEKWLAHRKHLSLSHELSKYENMLLGYKDIEKELEE